jgi:hypothetical protein
MPCTLDGIHGGIVLPTRGLPLLEKQWISHGKACRVCNESMPAMLGVKGSLPCTLYIRSVSRPAMPCGFLPPWSSRCGTDSAAAYGSKIRRGMGLSAAQLIILHCTAYHTAELRREFRLWSGEDCAGGGRRRKTRNCRLN